MHKLLDAIRKLLVVVQGATSADIVKFVLVVGSVAFLLLALR